MTSRGNFVFSLILWGLLVFRPMKKILRDSDVFKKPEHNTPNKYEDRRTVKIIIQNEKSEIALVTNPVHKIFMLPGGGTESDDLEQEAIREALEETNYHVQIIGKVGELEEFRNRNAKHYLTTCFFAKSIKEGEEDLRTEEEKENGLEVKWFKYDEALTILFNQVQQVKNNEVKFYNVAFNILRDYSFVVASESEFNKKD